MFAVKGWSLPSSGPTAQTPDPADKTKKAKQKAKKKKSKSAKHATGSNSVDMAPDAAAKLKQRERTARAAAAVDEEQQQQKKSSAAATAAAVVVNEQNVHKLWREVIEGAEAGAEGQRSKKRKRGSGKNPLRQQDGERGERGEAEEGPPPKKKTLKEKRREKKAAAATAAAAEMAGTSDAPAPAESAPAADATRQDAPSKLTPLQQKMRAKLASARFRHINETLYTSPSAASLALFAREPGMFADYHAGFRQQVAVWPANPVDTFVGLLRARAAAKFAKGHSRRALGSATALLPLPRDRATGVCTVADLGCGDAKIAATFNRRSEAAAKIIVLSYDLQASTPDVTVADIAHLPLAARTVDVVIFCLALMGTNFLEFVGEAHRVLRPRGELWVAEIKSRFNRPAAAGNAVGRRKQTGAEDAAAEPGEGEEPEMDGAERSAVPAPYRSFVDALSRRGFALKAGGLDDGNKMFVRMEFVKLLAQGEAEAAEAEAEAGGADEDGAEMEGRAAQGGAKPGAANARRKSMGKGKGRQKKTKFIGDELTEERLLKPCVYKLR